MLGRVFALLEVACTVTTGRGCAWKLPIATAPVVRLREFPSMCCLKVVQWWRDYSVNYENYVYASLVFHGDETYYQHESDTLDSFSLSVASR